MPSDTVSNDEFLARLPKLFEASKEKGSVWITQKRLTYVDPVSASSSTPEDDEEAAQNDSSLPSSSSYPVVIKASNGHIKFSTQVFSTSLLAFADLYHPLLKSTFALSLKKRDKKKEKARAESETKRRRELEGRLERVGGKLEEGKGRRGKGRGIRQKRLRSWYKNKLELSKLVAKEERKKAVAGGAI